MFGGRDKTIDGFRAVAALGVVFAHACNYRFAASAPHILQRLGTPLAQTSVELFFVISGFVITSILMNDKRGLLAFYVRRVCRIIPPLALLLLVVASFRLTNIRSLVMASTFTCNIGDCQWSVAHTWSLAIEEQFYFAWPALVPLNPRPQLVAVGIAALLLGFALSPTNFHSNYLSFACIGTGAWIAMTKPNIPASWLAWILAGVFLLFAPLYLPAAAQALTPFAIAYLLFGCPPLVKTTLATKPFQTAGGASYSIYLWQQLFLGANGFTLWGLPIVVIGSVFFIERPFISLGRRFSTRAEAGRLLYSRQSVSGTCQISET